jgi:hypothetical protein
MPSTRRRRETSMSQLVCSKGELFNHLSGACVSKTSNRGKALAAAEANAKRVLGSKTKTLKQKLAGVLKASAGLGVGALGAYGAYLASSRRFAQLASAAAAATKDATQTMNAGGPTTKGLLDRAMRLAGKTAAIGVVGAGGVAYAKKRGVTGQNVANAGREAVTRAANAAWDLGRLVRKKVNNLKGNRGRKWTANPLYGSGSAYI